MCENQFHYKHFLGLCEICFEDAIHENICDLFKYHAIDNQMSDQRKSELHNRGNLLKFSLLKTMLPISQRRVEIGGSRLSMVGE